MTSETDLKVALNFLANNWKHDQSLRLAFGAIFEKLEAGSAEDKANAQVLANYLAYPGSDKALESFVNLAAALKTNEGRNAAKLFVPYRGKKYAADRVKPNDKVMFVMIKFLLKNATSKELEHAVINHFNDVPSPKTYRKFIKELKPIAQSHIDFILRFKKARETNTSGRGCC